MGYLSVDLNNINRDDANLYKDEPKTMIPVRRFDLGLKL